MKSFEFSAHTIDLEICGEVYKADVSTETADYYIENVQPLLDKIRLGAKDKDSVNELLSAIRKFIDVVFGKGTAKKLLTGRKHPVNDTLDLCNFVVEALNEYNKTQYITPTVTTP